jgi:predicted unusual protein kinase regulating ubiquinone biosynthesis (AarF/ABC1/UbiB family)
MQEQVDEFVAGFVAELDFEAEADNHTRFAQRSLASRIWRVPELYGRSPRVLEMEYLADAQSLVRALADAEPRSRRRLQKQLTERLLLAVLQQVFVFRELHGDLHPGNIMVGRDGRLYLIDWGNVIDLEGKWETVWRYLGAACVADIDVLADVLIDASTQPAQHRARRAELLRGLSDTLHKKGVVPLTRRNVLRELRRGGVEGLRRRAQTVLHLMSNTQAMGIVLRSDYLHLSRAVMAVAGSFGAMYAGESRHRLARDLLGSLLRLPLTASREVVHYEITAFRDRWKRQPPRSLAPSAGTLQPLEAAV